MTNESHLAGSDADRRDPHGTRVAHDALLQERGPGSDGAPDSPLPPDVRTDHESNRGETEAEPYGIRDTAGREDRRLEGGVSQPVRRALPAGRPADRQGGRGPRPGSG